VPLVSPETSRPQLTEGLERREEEKYQKRHSTTLLYLLSSPSGGKLKEEQEEEEEEGGNRRTDGRTQHSSNKHTWVVCWYAFKPHTQKRKTFFSLLLLFFFFFPFHVTRVSFTIKTLRAQVDKRLGVSPGQVFHISFSSFFFYPAALDEQKERERGGTSGRP
jgi:hypothetical protein